MKLDIVISGVGGQGSVLASRALAQAAMGYELEVRTSEVIGMAQREGMVTSHVRIGKELFGAIIPDGQADILIGLELAETVRNLHKLKPGGMAIASSSTIIPVSVQLGISKYNREDLMGFLKENVNNIVFLDVEELSLRAGHPKTANVVLLGALSTAPGLPFSSEELLNAILSYLPEKLKDVNKRAFEIGRLAMEVA